jgi:hypothetical protein
MTTITEVKELLMTSFDESSTFNCGDEVYTREDMIDSAQTIAEEYDFKKEEEVIDETDTLLDYLNSMCN